MIARSIDWATLLLSLFIGVYFYDKATHKYDYNFLVPFASVPFLMIAGAIYDLIPHLIKPSVKNKGELHFYPTDYRVRICPGISNAQVHEIAYYVFQFFK